LQQTRTTTEASADEQSEI